MQAAAVDLTKYIEARLFEERPHIKGRRIPVALIARMAQKNAWTVSETAYNFTLSEGEILAALLYYEEHKEEIERQEAEEYEKFLEMKRLHEG
jgi:uncharacterized protein (DUF433 family)